MAIHVCISAPYMPFSIVSSEGGGEDLEEMRDE